MSRRSSRVKVNWLDGRESHCVCRRPIRALAGPLTHTTEVTPRSDHRFPLLYSRLETPLDALVGWLCVCVFGWVQWARRLRAGCPAAPKLLALWLVDQEHGAGRDDHHPVLGALSRQRQDLRAQGGGGGAWPSERARRANAYEAGGVTAQTHAPPVSLENTNATRPDTPSCFGATRTWPVFIFLAARLT